MQKIMSSINPELTLAAAGIIRQSGARTARQVTALKYAIAATVTTAAPLPAIEMTAVAGGTFMMGATPGQDDAGRADESPAHPVTLSDFFIGRYPVTQAQWEAVMGGNPAEFRGWPEERQPTPRQYGGNATAFPVRRFGPPDPGGNLPVEHVSWYDVQEFIRRLNARTGRTYRLPTEAEWEYAARGGRQSRGYKYSGGNQIDRVAWRRETSGLRTHPAGLKAANELGLCDMCGNVWEWTADWYGAYPGTAQTDPAGPPSGLYRVIRGGCWGSLAHDARVAARACHAPGSCGGGIGFRLACGARPDRQGGRLQRPGASMFH